MDHLRANLLEKCPLCNNDGCIIYVQRVTIDESLKLLEHVYTDIAMPHPQNTPYLSKRSGVMA